MELNIISPTQDMQLAPITWNYEELKTEIKQKTEVYKMMVFNEDQISEAKDSRANLNRLDKALNDKKMSLKKMYLEPYEEFEKQIKDLQRMIKDASGSIDVQVKAFEETERQEKLDKALETLLEFASAHGLHDFVPGAGWKSLVNPRWGNKSISNKAIADDVEAIVLGIKQDLETIKGLTDNAFVFEIADYYKRSMNLGQALQEGERLKRLEAEKKAHEERQQSLLEAREREEASRPPLQVVRPQETVVEPSPTAVAQIMPYIIQGKQVEPVKEPEKLYTLRFEVTGTQNELMALSSFLRGNNINFTQIKE